MYIYRYMYIVYIYNIVYIYETSISYKARTEWRLKFETHYELIVRKVFMFLMNKFLLFIFVNSNGIEFQNIMQLLICGYYGK